VKATLSPVLTINLLGLPQAALNSAAIDFLRRQTSALFYRLAVREMRISITTLLPHRLLLTMILQQAYPNVQNVANGTAQPIMIKEVGCVSVVCRIM
jgi:hypothetical protein